MNEHIIGTISHFCQFSNIYAYNVVNEVIRPDGQFWSFNPWASINDYVFKAFQLARSELNNCGRSNTRLFFNEFDFEYGRSKTYVSTTDFNFVAGEYNKSDKIYDFINGLKNRDAPIDGIGFQTHIYITTDHQNDRNDMTNTMKRFINLNLEVQITEMDVAIGGVNPQIYYQHQAQQYSDAIWACILALKCTGFTTWRTNDGETWYIWSKGFSIGKQMDPLLFYDKDEWVSDSNSQICGSPTLVSRVLYCPKPAYYAVYSALLQGITQHYLPVINQSGGTMYDQANPYPGPGEAQVVESFSIPSTSNPYPEPSALINEIIQNNENGVMNPYPYP